MTPREEGEGEEEREEHFYLLMKFPSFLLFFGYMKALFFELHESLKLLRSFEGNILLWFTIAVLTMTITFTTTSKIHHHHRSQSHKRNIFVGSQLSHKLERICMIFGQELFRVILPPPPPPLL